MLGISWLCLLQKHCAAWHWINTTVQTVRRQKAIPYKTDTSAFLLLDLQLSSFSQHSALQSSLFLQSIFRTSVPCVMSHQNHDAVTVTCPKNSTFLSTHQLLRRPFTAKASGRPAISSHKNRGAANVCSKQASILHQISAFV